MGLLSCASIFMNGLFRFMSISVALNVGILAGFFSHFDENGEKHSFFSVGFVVEGSNRLIS